MASLMTPICEMTAPIRSRTPKTGIAFPNLMRMTRSTGCRSCCANVRERRVWIEPSPEARARDFVRDLSRYRPRLGETLEDFRSLHQAPIPPAIRTLCSSAGARGRHARRHGGGNAGGRTSTGNCGGRNHIGLDVERQIGAVDGRRRSTFRAKRRACSSPELRWRIFLRSSWRERMPSLHRMCGRPVWPRWMAFPWPTPRRRRTIASARRWSCRASARGSSDSFRAKRTARDPAGRIAAGTVGDRPRGGFSKRVSHRGTAGTVGRRRESTTWNGLADFGERGRASGSMSDGALRRVGGASRQN